MVENCFKIWRPIDLGPDDKKGKKVDLDKKTKNCQIESAAEIIIENTKGHQGKGQKSYIPVSVFDNAKDFNINGDNKIDRDEVINWLNKMDKKDGVDGKISSATAEADDKFDLLGFKSAKTEALQKKADIRSTENGLNVLNEWAGNKFAMFFAEGKIIENMGKKPAMDYIQENESTKNLFAKTKDINPKLVRKILDKAYGKEEASKIFEKLKH